MKRAVLGLGAALWLAAALPLKSQSSPQGFWRGRGTTVRTSDIGMKEGAIPLVSLEIRYDSDFWFTVDRSGRVDGEAVVHYQMDLNDARLRGIAAYLNQASSAATGQLVPMLSGVIGVGASLKDLVGMRAGYDDGEPIRRGRITGSLQGDVLKIDWASPPPGLKYSIHRVYTLRDELQSSREAPAYAPWHGNATVFEVSPGEWQAVVPQTGMSGTKGTMRWSSYWLASRTSRP